MLKFTRRALSLVLAFTMALLLATITPTTADAANEEKVGMVNFFYNVHKTDITISGEFIVSAPNGRNITLNPANALVTDYNDTGTAYRFTEVTFGWMAGAYTLESYPIPSGYEVVSANALDGSSDGSKVLEEDVDDDGKGLPVLGYSIVLQKISSTPAPKLSATPSKTAFVMDGNPVSVPQAYNVSDSNYLQLRAIAVLLNGTAAQFDVTYDGKYAVIETGKPYSGSVTETALKETDNVRPSSTAFKIDGIVVTFEKAYLIDGDTNYLQLREVGEKLSGTSSQFNVYYDDAAKQAVIEPGKPYTGIAPVSSGVNTTEIKAAFTAYIGFLKERGEPKYMIADMCGDGVSELLVLESSPSDPYVYACVYDKNLNLLLRQAVADEGGGGTKGAVFTATDGLYVFDSNPATGAVVQTFTKYKLDGKLTAAEKLQSSQSGAVTTYSRDGKQIAETEYNQLRAAIVGGVSAVFYDGANIVSKGGVWLPSYADNAVCLVGKVESVPFDGRNVYALSLVADEQAAQYNPLLLISVGVTAFATPDFVNKNVIVIGDIMPGRGDEGYLTMTYMVEAN